MLKRIETAEQVVERTAQAARESFDRMEILQDQRSSQQDEKMHEMQK